MVSHSKGSEIVERQGKSCIAQVIDHAGSFKFEMCSAPVAFEGDCRNLLGFPEEGDPNMCE